MSESLSKEQEETVLVCLEDLDARGGPMVFDV